MAFSSCCRRHTYPSRCHRPRQDWCRVQLLRRALLRRRAKGIKSRHPKSTDWASSSSVPVGRYRAIDLLLLVPNLPFWFLVIRNKTQEWVWKYSASTTWNRDNINQWQALEFHSKTWILYENWNMGFYSVGSLGVYPCVRSEFTNLQQYWLGIYQSAAH
jgi:hypothetical protein